MTICGFRGSFVLTLFDDYWHTGSLTVTAGFLLHPAIAWQEIGKPTACNFQWNIEKLSFLHYCSRTDQTNEKQRSGQQALLCT